MSRVLVPVDGSENALRAVRHVAKLARGREPVEIHLINVQPSLRGGVATFVGSKTVRDYHVEEAQKSLASAKAELDKAGIPYDVHICVGNAGEQIVAFAESLKCDSIVMGTRGLGGFAGAVLGSVSNDVIQRANIPITLVK